MSSYLSSPEVVAQSYGELRRRTIEMLRSLPDDMADLITVGMGGNALLDLLSEVELDVLIKQLSEEAEEAKGQRKKKS